MLVSNRGGGCGLDHYCENTQDLIFPNYGDSLAFPQVKQYRAAEHSRPGYLSDPAPSPTKGYVPFTLSDPFGSSEDDSVIRPQPSEQVDYYTYEWLEEDLWATWKHLLSHRGVYFQWLRLENASWRIWSRYTFKRERIDPECLNWYKEQDTDYLYGPIQPAKDQPISRRRSEPPSYLSTNNSFLNKKPILKKKTVSEIMVQSCLSNSSLVRQAAAAVQAQQNMTSRVGINDRRASDQVTATLHFRTTSRASTDCFSSSSASGLQTPADQIERKHIRFDNKVEQCIAVEAKGYDDDDDYDFWRMKGNDDDSDDGIVMMKRTRRRRSARNTRAHARRHSSAENKIIAKLPSTTLKYRTDSPDLSDAPSHSIGGGIPWIGRRLSPSPSLETLRPSCRTKKFLFPEDDEFDDALSWEPSMAFASRADHKPVFEAPRFHVPKVGEKNGEESLRRTSSGMFMPYDGSGEDGAVGGILGRVADTVNTARDIAHVIWNVGWRR